MAIPPPTLEELERRVKEHLALRPENEKVIMIWKGHLAGLLEFGTIDIKTYDAVRELLPKIGSQELEELLGGLPGDLLDDEPSQTASSA